MLEIWIAFIVPPTALAAESTHGHSHRVLNVFFIDVRILIIQCKDKYCIASLTQILTSPMLHQITISFPGRKLFPGVISRL